VENDTPAPGNFTCHVTLTNQGSLPARGIEILVRPYRGTNFGTDEVGHSFRVLTEDDPLSQLSTSVTFPDLDPGKSQTEDVVFTRQLGAHPGQNPKPAIVFESVKANP